LDEIVLPFLVRYEGRDADAHVLEADALGESLSGAARVYGVIAHFSAFGIIPTSRRYKKHLACYARPAAPGSWDQWVFIAPLLAGQFALHAAVYNAAISYVFNVTVTALKEFWTKPRGTQVVINEFAELLRERAERDDRFREMLFQGVLKGQNDLAALHGRLIDALPELANSTRSGAERFVTPIGKTCERIEQFSGTEQANTISEADADVIRGGPEMEVGDMARFAVSRINEINLSTGHCVLDVVGVDGPVTGKITDPALQTPNNVYTRALNEHTGCNVDAKPVRKDGSIHRLYVSNATDE
jgi:hypothetical protein